MRLQNRQRLCFSWARKETRTNERGFTLLETAIAMIVMMVAALAATSLFLYSINYNSGTNDRELAMAVAQQSMEQLRSQPFWNLSSMAGTTTTTSNGRSYRVVTTVANTTATLKTITVQVTPQGAGEQWARAPVTLITQRASLTTGTY